MHCDRGRRARIDRTSRPELRDGQHGRAVLASLLRQTNRLLAHQQNGITREVEGFQGHCTWQVVDTEEDEPLGLAPLGQICRRRVVTHMLVSISHHGATAIPALAAHDVDLFRQEGIGRAHDGADVEIMCEVLDSDVEVMAARIEVRDDRLKPPVPVLVNDITSITLTQQVRVEVGVIRPRALPRADTHVWRAGLIHLTTIACTDGSDERCCPSRHRPRAAVA